MICVHMEIPFLHQLERVAEEGTLQIVRDAARSIASRAMKDASPAKAREYLLDEARPGAYLQATQAVWSAFATLREAAGDLVGFSIGVDLAQEGEEEKAFGRLRKMAGERGSEECIFIGQAARAAFEEFLDSEDSGGGWALSRSLREIGPKPLAGERSYPRRPALAEALLPLLGPRAEDAAERPAALLVGDPEGLAQGIADAAAEAGLGQASVLRIAGSGLNTFSLTPLLECASADVGAMAAARFAAAERAVFLEMSQTASYLQRCWCRNGFPEHILRSFSIYFRMLVDLRRRDAEARGEFLVVLVEDYDALSEEARKIVDELFAPGSGFACLRHARSADAKVGGVRAAAVPIPLPNNEERKQFIRLRSGELGEKEESLYAAATLDMGFLGLKRYLYLSLAGDADEGRPEEAVLASLPRDMLELLYLFALSDRLLEGAARREMFESCGVSAEALEEAAGTLVAAGLLEEGPEPRVARGVGIKDLRDRLGDRGERVEARFRAHVAALYGRGEVFLSSEFYASGPAGPGVDQMAFFIECAVHDLNEGMGIVRPGKELGPEGKALVQALSAVYETGRRGAEAFLRADDPGARAAWRPLPRAYIELSRSYVLYALGDCAAAMKEAKGALLDFQELRVPRGESRANRLLGLLMLAGEQLFAACDYFAIAYEIAEESHDDYECMISSLHEAIGNFIQGNYSRIEECLGRTRRHARRLLRKDYELYSCFIAGRTAFELGDYAGAERAFLEGLSENRVYGFIGASELFSAWLARTLAYTGRAERAIEMLGDLPETADACLFLGEASFLDGEQEAAFQALVKVAKYSERPDYDSPEVLDWASGFASLEDRSLGFKTGERVAAHYAAALERAVRHRSRQEEGALAALAALTREQKISDLDPNASVYYYLYYSSLPVDGPSAGIDRATVLSKAFKHLQMRSGRIDTIEHRNSFLKAYWNSRIMEEAKEHKMF